MIEIVVNLMVTPKWKCIKRIINLHEQARLANMIKDSDWLRPFEVDSCWSNWRSMKPFIIVQTKYIIFILVY
jgi:hypothetical protein